jgi:SRSO17 transposase
MPDFIVEDVEPAVWLAELSALHERTKPSFPSHTTWSVAGSYVVGLLSRTERKNCWQMAEELGEAAPYRLQHLLGRAVWEADMVRDVVRSYTYEHLAHPLGVHILDNSAFPKKGDQSVGVKRQYCGVAGKMDNCQVGVFLTYASPHGAAIIDREIFLPEEWATDPARREKAGVPERVSFGTKSELGQGLLARAFAAGAPAGWVTGDEEFGKSGPLRHWLEEQARRYVLAVASNQYVWRGFENKTVKQILATLAPDAWQTLSAGAGSKGQRLYDWAVVATNGEPRDGWRRWLMFRKSLADGEIAYYLAAGPADTPLAELVRVAGARWAIETDFEHAKQEVGLDRYEVRSWHGWYRHITLSMLALAYLVVMRHRAAASAAEKGGFPMKSPRRARMTKFKRRQARQNELWKLVRHPSSG